MLATLCFSSHAELQISDAWVSKPIAGGKNAAGYLTIENKGDDVAEITSVSCEMAVTCQIHLSSNEGGTHRMRQLPSVEIPAGQIVKFEPGALHVMVMGIDEAFHQAQALPVVFTLKNNTTVSTELTIKKMHHKHH